MKLYRIIEDYHRPTQRMGWIIAKDKTAAMEIFVDVAKSHSLPVFAHLDEGADTTETNADWVCSG